MKRLKGPELKLSELRAPAFVADVFYDLRDRRLLPLVALVLVAIAAVPFLLGGGEEPVPPPAALDAALEAQGEAGGATLAVVEATPGLRDYRRRLRRRSPTDPFVQRYTAPMIEDAKLNPESGSGGGAPSAEKTTTKTVVEMEKDGEVVVTETETEGGGKGADKGSGESPAPGATRSFDVLVDFQISRSERGVDDFERMSPPRLRRRVPALTQLPGPKAPVVTTMGVDREKKTVLLMVSGGVESVFGDARCVSGTDSCQLLEAPLGFPLIFVYGPGKVRYKIKPHSFSK